MSKLDKEEVIANFTAAYNAANGKDPVVEAKGGWYSVDGGKNLRLVALVDMTAELSGDAPAAEEAAPAAKPAKKAAPKAKAASAASASNGPSDVSAGDGMKPADFWKSRLDGSGQECTLPRGI
jgi:hypothetical protein